MTSDEKRLRTCEDILFENETFFPQIVRQERLISSSKNMVIDQKEP